MDPLKVPMPPNTPVKRRPSENGRTGPACVLVRKIDEGSFYRIYLTAQGTVVRVAKRVTAGIYEAAVLASLDSPHINRMLRWWTEDGVVHFEMEYCPNGNLSVLLEQRRGRPAAFDRTRDRELSHRRHAGSAGDRRPSCEPVARPCDRAAHDPLPSNVLVDPFSDLETAVGANTSYIYTDNESESSDSPFVPCAIEHPRWIARLMFQLSAGLAYLHAKNIIHMDVKPANVLVDGTDYRICDFNISRMGEGSVDLDGDCIYMAPEILKNKCYFSSDIFSLGIIYLELCNPGLAPPSGGEAYRKIRRNDFGGWRLDEIGRAMLEKDPAKRCSALSVSRYFEKHMP